MTGIQYLVTGGAGFIGSHLVEALVTAGHTAVVLDDLSTGKLRNLALVRDRIRFIRGSVTDPAAVGARWSAWTTCSMRRR